MLKCLEGDKTPEILKLQGKKEKKKTKKGRKTAALCWNFQNRENKQPFYYLNLEAANKI